MVKKGWSGVELDLGCTFTKRNDTIARTNGENTGQSAHSIHPSLHTATCFVICYLRVNLWII